MRISPLDRKLLRDLWGMKGQALAIALVVASGVAMFVAYFSNFDSLQRTLDAYYESQRFGHVFASLKRAPMRVAERVAEIPGIAAVEARVVVDVTLDVPDMPEPATGRIISIPSTGRPRLNGVFLKDGRWPATGRPDEIVAGLPFAEAHRLRPGDRIAALINGRRRQLLIVGLGLSPEYIYTIRPGEVIPDPKRFGVLWMDRRALASAFDMEGGFNDLSLSLLRGTPSDTVLSPVDRLLAPWGGTGARTRELQPSHWTISQELKNLRIFGVLVPSIFLGVAAFLLNVSLTRTLAIQRPQIASLKALGYTNAEIGWHYLKWSLLIAAVGALIGIALGYRLGLTIIGLYNIYFRFPALLYQLSTGVTLGAVVFALTAALVGAAFAVHRAVAIPPAEAMRPEAPESHRPSIVERHRLGRHLTHTLRMILRNVERAPWRSTATVTGIALGVALLLFGFVFLDVMVDLADTQFGLVQRQDVTVSFVEPASSRALFEIARLPGVLAAEPIRVVPARLRHGHRERHLAVTGMPAPPRLSRIVSVHGAVGSLPPEGLVLSSILGEILGVSVGDRIEVEILEGRRPVRSIEVAALVEDSLGLSAWMEIGALHRLMREQGTLSGAHLLVDPASVGQLYRELKTTPRVAGIALTSAALESFRAIMAQNFEIITTFNVAFAVIIAFGVVYNTARISLSERSRELASLRVLGFTIAEISLILLGELALLTALALPVGMVIGWLLAEGLLLAFENEVYRFPLVLTAQNVAISALVTIAAAFLSGLAVRRKLDHLDLVAVLKTRE